MMRTLSRSAFMALALGLTACDEPPGLEPLGAASPAAGNAPRFAVISSDWSATSISLLDGEGNVVADGYLHSGSQPSGLVTALSGDVELASPSGEEGVLVILDRYRTDVITRVRLSDGAILGQVKMHTPPSQGTDYAYSSNPHDYVYIDEHTAWVSRFEPNLNPALAELDRGNDLIRIDPSAMVRTSERIDLSGLDGVATRRDPDTGESEQVPVYARPSAITRVGDTLVVGLAGMAFDFSAVGEGKIALVDLETRRVEGFAIEGLASCSSVSSVPGAASRVLVSCAGFYAGLRRDTGGLVLLDVGEDGAEVVAAFRAQDYPDAPLFASPAVPIGGTLVVVAANDWSGSTPDVLAVLDLASGRYTELARHEPGSGSYGTPAFDASTGLLLVPDSSTDGDGRPTAGVLRFARMEDGSFVERGVARVAEDTGMPARHVTPL